MNQSMMVTDWLCLMKSGISDAVTESKKLCYLLIFFFIKINFYNYQLKLNNKKVLLSSDGT
jgi:hypothetical protein